MAVIDGLGWCVKLTVIIGDSIRGRIIELGVFTTTTHIGVVLFIRAIGRTVLVGSATAEPEDLVGEHGYVDESYQDQEDTEDGTNGLDRLNLYHHFITFHLLWVRCYRLPIRQSFKPVLILIFCDERNGII